MTNIVLVLFSSFAFLNSSTVRVKGEVLLGNLESYTQTAESQQKLSRDESRRVSKEATLLSEGGMAMEYGTYFQEGRTPWTGIWILLGLFSCSALDISSLS